MILLRIFKLTSRSSTHVQIVNISAAVSRPEDLGEHVRPDFTKSVAAAYLSLSKGPYLLPRYRRMHLRRWCLG
jgi:hypothetical protein